MNPATDSVLRTSRTPIRGIRALSRSAAAAVLLIASVAAAPLDLDAQTTRADRAREGPYERLVIANAMVIPGHGGPAYGPADIVIEDSTIVEINAYNGVTGRPDDAPVPEGDRVIDASGMYVMPGLVDLHTHVRSEPLPLQYVYDLKLAHGVTTMVNGAGRGWEEALRQQRLSASNEITAPRMYPIRDWGPSRSRNPGGEPPADEIAPWHDPGQAPELARRIVGEGEAHVVRIGSLAFDRELFGAVADAVREAGGVTTVHLPPSDLAVVDAVTAAELGVTMIEHHYGYAESALGETVQAFPGDYNYMNELSLFRQAGEVWGEARDEVLFGEVAERLAESGVAMAPTMSTYEVNRDVNRAMGLPWHESLTHRQLIEWYYPSPEHHAAYHWDWTSGDEATWAQTYRKWGRLMREFQERGGNLSYATDDPWLWNTSGVANVRELQLMRQAGIGALEVIRAATYNSARTLRRPDLGLVQVGKTADLAIVDGNPLHNLRYLYAFGALTRSDGEIRRTGGIRWTIKAGTVFDNAALMQEVVDMVAESKEGWESPVDSLFAPRFGDAQAEDGTD